MSYVLRLESDNKFRDLTTTNNNRIASGWETHSIMDRIRHKWADGMDSIDEDGLEYLDSKIPNKNLIHDSVCKHISYCMCLD